MFYFRFILCIGNSLYSQWILLPSLFIQEHVDNIIYYACATCCLGAFSYYRCQQRHGLHLLVCKSIVCYYVQRESPNMLFHMLALLTSLILLSLYIDNWFGMKFSSTNTFGTQIIASYIWFQCFTQTNQITYHHIRH